VRNDRIVHPSACHGAARSSGSHVLAKYVLPATDRPLPEAHVDHPALSGRYAGLARREREAGAPVELTVVAETDRQEPRRETCRSVRA
jgi:hypothetical protein